MKTEERELLLPALQVILRNSGINTTGIKQILIRTFEWKEEDFEPSPTRNEPKYEQIIRNLVSHKTIKQYVVEEIRDGRACFTLNSDGLELLLYHGYDISLGTYTSVESEEEVQVQNNRVPELVTGTNTRYVRSAAVRNSVANQSHGHCYNACGNPIFKSKNGLPYIEVHHVIPMSYQRETKINLDCTNNMVALCPSCHSYIHNGYRDENYDYCLRRMYNYVSGGMQINITFEELKELYR